MTTLTKGQGNYIINGHLVIIDQPGLTVGFGDNVEFRQYDTPVIAELAYADLYPERYAAMNAAENPPEPDMMEPAYE